MDTYFEVTNIDHVKSDESGVQTHVSLSEGGASEVALTGEDLFRSIESSKQFPHSFVVGFLLGCKTSTIHSIVDIPITEERNNIKILNAGFYRVKWKKVIQYLYIHSFISSMSSLRCSG